MEIFLDEQELKPRSSCIKIDPISGDVSLQRKIPKIQTILAIVTDSDYSDLVKLMLSYL